MVQVYLQLFARGRVEANELEREHLTVTLAKCRRLPQMMWLGKENRQTVNTDLPRENTNLRFSVQAIDNRRIPMALMQTNDESEAKKAFDDLCSHFFWRHLFLCDGGNIIVDRPRLTR